jgi:hypothetical protein
VPGKVPHTERLALLDAGFRSLPERYLGAERDVDDEPERRAA